MTTLSSVSVCLFSDILYVSTLLKKQHLALTVGHRLQENFTYPPQTTNLLIWTCYVTATLGEKNFKNLYIADCLLIENSISLLKSLNTSPFTWSDLFQVQNLQTFVNHCFLRVRKNLSHYYASFLKKKKRQYKIFNT